jgi:hypothetical protein
MALSDALLGFATGAAGVINTDAEANRDFMRKHKAKINESKLIRQEKAHDAAKAKYDTVQEWGSGPQGQYMHLKSAGLDHDQAVKAVKDPVFAAKVKKKLDGVKNPGVWIPGAIGISDEEYRAQYGTETVGSKLLGKFSSLTERRKGYREDEATGRAADSAAEAQMAVDTFGEEAPTPTAADELSSGFFTSEEESPQDELLRMDAERVEIEGRLERDPTNEDDKRLLTNINNRIEKISTFGRTDADLDFKTRNQRQLAQVTNNITNIDIALRSLTQLSKTATQKHKGAAGAVAGFKNAIVDTVRGLTDLTSFTESSTDADRISQVQATGITDANLDELTGGALKGLNRVDQYNAIYAIAGGMKDFQRKAVNNLDIQLAMDLLKKSGGSEGAGVILGLEQSLRTRQSQLYKSTYLMEGLTPNESARFGREYLKSIDVERAKNDGTNNGYKMNEKGEIFISTPDGKLILLKDFLVRGG